MNVSRTIERLDSAQRLLSRAIQELLYLVGLFACFRSFLRGELGYISQETGDNPFSAEILNADLVYCVSIRSGREFRESLFLNLIYCIFHFLNSV